MGDLRDRTYRVLRDRTNRLLLSVATAYALFAYSIVSFSLAPGDDVTRLQFALLAGAGGLLFYSLVRAETVR
ncbi:hypothetical protein [Halomarina pelagica]|uniref:hypothetical protein n=1 Tax=Halomarina pelagica TaxID=2961599 RepID=UPI0020C37673|nr:hypothetical protein [Halomarina sp. BND7]